MQLFFSILFVALVFFIYATFKKIVLNKLHCIVLHVAHDVQGFIQALTNWSTILLLYDRFNEPQATNREVGFGS